MLKDKLKIVLITYNRSYCLDRTLKQLFSSDSPIKECEFTILDNASSDDTQAVVRKYQERFPHITYVRHPVNISGYGNVCRAYETLAGSDKEYGWVLCDDDYYDWRSWKEVEQAMNQNVDCIGVARYAIPNDEDLKNIPYQMLQLTFVPAGIYKISNITDTVISNMYFSMYALVSQNALPIHIINTNGTFRFIKKPIVEQGLHVKDKKAPKLDVSYTRGLDIREVSFRQKESLWIVGYANIVTLLKDEELQKKCIEQAILFKDIHGSWDLFMSGMLNLYMTPEKVHYALECATVLPQHYQEKLRKMCCRVLIGKATTITPSQHSWFKFLIESLFSIKNSRDKKYKIVKIFGMQLKFKRQQKER